MRGYKFKRNRDNKKGESILLKMSMEKKRLQKYMQSENLNIRK